MFTVQVVPWRSRLDRQSSKQERVDSCPAVDKNFSFCNSRFLRVPHSLNERLAVNVRPTLKVQSVPNVGPTSEYLQNYVGPTLARCYSNGWNDVRWVKVGRYFIHGLFDLFYDLYKTNLLFMNKYFI